MDKEFYSIDEFATEIAYSSRQVRQMCIDGKILANKLEDGRKWIIPASELERLKGQVGYREKPYEETLHKRQIRDCAKRLAEGIRLPSLWDSKMWNDLPIEFKPGKYSLPIGVVDIGKDKQVDVKYHTDTGITTPHLLESLYSHLRTSGFPKFSELVEEKGKLESWASEVGQYSKVGLSLLKLIIADIEGRRAKVRFRDEEEPGLTKWFLLTVWNDAIQKAIGYSWIDDSWYHPPEPSTPSNLWQLRCGAYIIGIDRSERTLKTYEKWHKKLRVTHSENPLVKDIAAKGQELNDSAEEIRQRLQEFSDMQHLPGHCELC